MVSLAMPRSSTSKPSSGRSGEIRTRDPLLPKKGSAVPTPAKSDLFVPPQTTLFHIGSRQTCAHLARNPSAGRPLLVGNRRRVARRPVLEARAVMAVDLLQGRGRHAEIAGGFEDGHLVLHGQLDVHEHEIGVI